MSRIVYRSAVTGEFVTQEEAEANPDTTYAQRVDLYDKYHVQRTDGRDTPGEKHDGCQYFVLDLTHDHHSLPALRAYAESLRPDNPLLAQELDDLVIKQSQTF